MKINAFGRAFPVRTVMLAGVAALGLTLPAAAMAQDAPASAPDAAAPDTSYDSNTIIVTASKREQTLQDTPIAVSVTSGQTLERAQIRDLSDLQTVVPSLQVSQLQSSANTNFIIRGFGNGANNAGIEPSVGVYIDGVYRSRSAAQIGDLANVSRIEVLRGPQSTLFGKNASAGVISIVTRAPQFDFGGHVSGVYGNFNQIVLKGDVTGPISKTVAFSLEGNYNKRDGYVDVPNLNAKINERNRYGVRGQILFEPSSDFKLRAIGDFSRINELCCYAGNIVAGPTVPAIFALGGNVAANDLFSDKAYLNILPENKIDSYGGSVQMDYTSGNLSFTSISGYRGLKSFNSQDVDFTSADIVNQITDQKIDTITQELRVASDFDGPLNFLLGGFYFNEKIKQTGQLVTGQDARNFFSLLTGNPAIFNGVEAGLGLPQGSIFSPGLLTSEAYTMNDQAYSVFGTVDFKLTDKLTLTGGLNYTNDKKNFTANMTAYDPLANINLVDAVIVGQIAGALAIPPSQVTPAVIAGFAQAQPAGFAAIAAAATDPTVNPLLGLRPFQFQPPFLNIPNSVEPGKTADDKVTYTARLAYEISKEINVYATYATGYKASSVNLSRDARPLPSDYTPGPFGSIILAPSSPILNAGLAVPNLSTGTRIAGPENSTVYEVGVKAQFPRFGFNLALFKQDVKGFQTNIFTGTGFALANAGKESVKGFEFDTTLVPTDPLVITFAMTYLDPIYDSFPNSSVGDLTGQVPSGIPKISLATSATYTQEIGSSGNALIWRVDFNHTSNTPLTNGLPAFGPSAAKMFFTETNLLNGSLTFQMENGISVGVFGRNIFNDRTITTVFDGVAQAGTVSGYPSEPRTYGATLGLKF